MKVINVKRKFVEFKRCKIRKSYGVLAKLIIRSPFNPYSALHAIALIV